VADIGAGPGYSTVRIAEQTAARVVFAVDIEPAMVDHVRERAVEAGLAQIAGVLAAPDSPNLPEPVDVALIVNTFHHIADRVAYFRGLRDSLAPGARLAIVDHRRGAPGGGPPDEFRFTPDEIDAELARAGYRRQARHDFLPRQSFLVYGVSEPAGNR
ncbi:MAG: class I SAM-dependent methyltransferase, partial [Acidobacteria bacterium]|nr:class I SAM-dependent methyltransferase [Acidobacteriota bacterium]